MALEATTFALDEACFVVQKDLLFFPGDFIVLI
jgi:hypothetical protein